MHRALPDPVVGSARRRGALCVAAVIGVVSVLAVGLVGCSSSASPTASDGPPGTVSHAASNAVVSDDTPRPGGKIVYALSAESNGWNPATNEWGPQGEMVAHALFDTLTAYGEDGDLHPNLLASYTPNPDFTQWTFKLRDGVTLSNGKPVDAETVVADQQYLQTSAITKDAYVYIDSFTASDPMTVVVKTKMKMVDLPKSFASQIGVVVDPDWLKSNDSLHPIGTGPFTLDSWAPGNNLIAKRNPHYWQKDQYGNSYPYLDSVEFRIITDDTSRRQAMRAGDIDAMQSFSGQQILDFQKTDGYQVLTDPTAETDENFILLNTQAAPLDDIDARRALAYATDKQAIIDLSTGGYDEPANSPYKTNSRWYVDTGYPQYDPNQARALVAKVKASHGGQFTFTLTGFGDPSNQALQQALQQQWAAVGITVTLETLEQAAVVIKSVTGKFQAMTFFQFNYEDPYEDSAFWNSRYADAPPAFSLNFARWKNSTAATAIDAAMGAETMPAAKAQWDIVQKQMADDVPYLWLYHQDVGIIASTRLVNVLHWTLPDGSPGLQLTQGAHPLFQVWLRS